MKTQKTFISKIEETLIEIGIKIAKRGEGALFVIGNTKYDELVEQKVPPFNILSNPKLLESLALMDGAVIIDKSGFMRAYGVKVKSNKTLKNFGTRHSAGLSASVNGNISIVVSEEDKKIRIMKNGKLVMQIDALQKGVEKTIPKAVQILESVGVGAVGVLGTSLIVPSLGLALLPGIVLFGSAYYITKYLAKFIGKK
ncbi:MAG: DNA integrity scanning protein DisA nucleotide-binding domain protein [Candidatus Pacearchaeota archaeon]|jgi:DNA integrity scanning protein DisA with diadenylate cyclase activity